jgi:hypothetical protein
MSRSPGPLSADDGDYVFRQVRRKKGSPERGSDSPRPNSPKWRKYAAWTLIALLAGAAIAEFRAQWLFRKNLRVCQEALDRGEEHDELSAKNGVTYAQLKDRFTSQPKTSTAVHSFVRCTVYTWQWQGMRHYTLRLLTDAKSGILFEVETDP